MSDGLACFTAVTEAKCEHFSTVTGGGPESVTKDQFIWVNTMIGNVKNSITGTYHSIKAKHLPRYLAEYCYRFNRRFTHGRHVTPFYACRLTDCTYATKIKIFEYG